MNDIKLGISKSRGYENVDLEEMCNKKTPQDGEQKGGNKMEVKVSADVVSIEQLKDLVAVLVDIEKEHNVSCTLEVKI